MSLEALREQRLTLQQRLKEADLEIKRFHPLNHQRKDTFENFKEKTFYVNELDDSPSIGVNVGDGLIVLDIDQDGYEGLNGVFGDTFTVKSGGKGKPHYYYKIDKNANFELATMCLVFGEYTRATWLLALMILFMPPLDKTAKTLKLKTAKHKDWANNGKTTWWLLTVTKS